MTTESWLLYDRSAPAEPAPVELPARVETQRGALRFDWRVHHAGPGAGVQLLTIETEETGITLLPTRGMGIWRGRANETPIGWQSPVQGPVHPSLVPLWDPSGLGWLEGFDELLVRCGLESNGAPDFDAAGRLRWPLHGRIANRPASRLELAVDRAAGSVEITGTVRETRLFFTNLELQSTVRMFADSPRVQIEDRVQNCGAQAATHQMLYHINLGAPVLGEGARLIAAPAEIAPKDALSASEFQRWSEYDGPTVGYAERVYFMRPAVDAEGWSGALLASADRTRGMGVRFDTATLPYFIQWKNTAAEADGYVTGLEPATNFPNPRSFEEQQGRIVPLEPGETITHRIELHLLGNAERVAAMEQEIGKLAAQTPATEHAEPRAGWSG